ncbi:MAG: ABC transporter permease [Rubrivivax sp.]|nr:MAG: ABC transporter permease [Rubrivivax sp.]
MSLHRIYAIALKEWLHMVRDRLTFISLMIATVSYVIVFGYAINPDPRQIDTIMVDHDKSEFSRLYRAALIKSNYLNIDPREMSAEQASDYLRRARTSVVIEIPSDFTANMLAGKAAQLLVEADATDPVSLNGAISSTAEVARQTAAHVLRQDQLHMNTLGPKIEVRVQRRFNPQGEHTFFIMPGVIGMILNMSLIMMTAMSITREKERGSMEFMMVTPTKPSEVIVGKMIPYFFMGVVQVLSILAIAFWLFKMPLTGSVTALASLLLTYGVTTLMVGILISTAAASQIQAMQLSFYYMMPTIMLSGFMFPYSGMPHWAQWISSTLPMTYFIRGARGVFLKEFSMVDMWPNLWPIGLACLVFLVTSIKSYRKTLS